MWLEERASGVWKEEELGVRYFRAVGVTTKALLETVVAMVFLTSTALGYGTVREYCRRQLKWRRSDMTNVFTKRERRFLQADPTEKPFGAELNIKLLTKVWTGLGEDVAKRVEELRRLTLTAIHEPSRITSREHLWKDFDLLFLKQKELTHSVLTYCHRTLEENLSSLLKEKILLKRGYGVIYKELMAMESTICFAPIDRAVADMELTYQVLTIVEGKIPDLGTSHSLPKILKDLLEKTRTLDLFGKRLNMYKERNRELAARIDKIKEVYTYLIDCSSLYNIIEELNYIGGTHVSTHDLRDWHQTFVNLRQERKERLKVVGRSELLSHSAWGDACLYDVSRWLITRRAATVNVEKVYSLLRRSDTNEVTTVDGFFSIKMPQVIILSGPMGSGKTCLRHYLYSKWQFGCASVRYLSEFQLFISLTAENVRSGSFLHHLKTKVFPRAMAGLGDTEVLDTLRQLKVLFFIDSVIGAMGDQAAALEELITALGRSTVIIATRPEETREVLQISRHLKINPVIADVLPVAESQLKNLCLDFIKVLYSPENSTLADRFHLNYNKKNDHPPERGLTVAPSSRGCDRVHVSRMPEGCPHEAEGCLRYTCTCGWLGVIENSVNKFLEKLLSEKREEELLYPLPLAYMIMLWLEEPRRLNNIQTVSHLYEEVVTFCESELSAKVQDLCVAEKKEVRRKSKEIMMKVFKAASRMFRNGTASSPTLNTDAKEDLSVSEVYLDSLFPFVICLSKTDGHHSKHQQRFLHPSVIDVLHARDVVLMLSQERAKHLCFKPDLPDVLPLSLVERLGGRYLNVLKYLCGFLSRKNPLRASTATYIVRLVKCAGVGVEDYHTWESFLREGEWSHELKRAVSDVLVRCHTWKAPHHGAQLETGAVAGLVTRGVYLPRQVIITTEASEEVVNMLLSRPDIDVVIPPAPGLQSMSKARKQDSLLKALCEACSVTELWGRLGQEGADALASMKRLHTMHVHLSTLSAFVAFSENVKSCLALRTLHLHLDLPANTAARTLPPLRCPASATVCLILYGITDDSLDWVVNFAGSLGRRCQEVHLTRSRLSSLPLQQIKDHLHPTPVHVSG